jgi:hypothetical protein
MRPTLEERPCSRVWKLAEAPLARSAHLLNGSALPRTRPITEGLGEISVATE